MDPLRPTITTYWVLFTILAYLSPLISITSGHPQCLTSYAPFDTVQLAFCSDYSNFGCCTHERDIEIRNRYHSLTSQVSTSNCRDKLKELLCQECSPYAAHLFKTESTGVKSALPILCQSYCTSLHQECAEIIPLATDNDNILDASDTSTATFCNIVADESAYCYPDIRDDQDLLNWIEESRNGTGRYADGCVCLDEFANNLRNPILAIHANDSTHRLFIAEQVGVVHVYLHNKTKLNEPFLDIRSVVVTSTRTGDERGFLGLAFHPNHATNRKVYVYYCHQDASDGHIIRIAEYRTFSDNPNEVDLGTERVILEVAQPRANHNGGQLLFGTDGYLYAVIGDGGGAGDQFGSQGNGQNLATLLGSVIRIDVNRQENGKQYGIPPDNPFVNEDPNVKRHEIYAYGTRNMWRCSVDRGDPETGDGKGRIFCGDVGQNLYEEVDIIVKGGNYGWRGKEGDVCYDQNQCYGIENEVLPINIYDHNIGRSITGGYVYRGCQSPKLQGKYIFGDYVNGRMFRLKEEGSNWYREDVCFGDNTICTSGLVNTYPTKILSFGEDEAGEVYVLTTDRARTDNYGGKVFKIVEPSESGANCGINQNPVTVSGGTTPFVPTLQPDVTTQQPPPTETDADILPTTISTSENADVTTQQPLPSVTDADILPTTISKSGNAVTSQRSSPTVSDADILATTTSLGENAEVTTQQSPSTVTDADILPTTSSTSRKADVTTQQPPQTVTDADVLATTISTSGKEDVMTQQPPPTVTGADILATTISTSENVDVTTQQPPQTVTDADILATTISTSETADVTTQRLPTTVTDGDILATSEVKVFKFLRGELTVTSVEGVSATFSPALSDPNSSTFKQLAGLVCAEITIALSEISVKLYTCKVVEFTSGSIVAVYVLTVDDDDDDSTASNDDISTAVTSHLTSDVSAIGVQGSSSKLTDICSNVTCLNEGWCVADEDFKGVCMCPEGIKGDSCDMLPPEKSPNGSGGLSSAAVAGIVFACLICIMIVFIIIVYFMRLRRNRSGESDSDKENAKPGVELVASGEGGREGKDYQDVDEGKVNTAIDEEEEGDVEKGTKEMNENKYIEVLTPVVGDNNEKGDGSDAGTSDKEEGSQGENEVGENKKEGDVEGKDEKRKAEDESKKKKINEMGVSDESRETDNGKDDETVNEEKLENVDE